MDEAICNAYLLFLELDVNSSDEKASCVCVLHCIAATVRFCMKGEAAAHLAFWLNILVSFPRLIPPVALYRTASLSSAESNYSGASSGEMVGTEPRVQKIGLLRAATGRHCRLLLQL